MLAMAAMQYEVELEVEIFVSPSRRRTMYYQSR
jgi:hypothetical protein